MSSVLTATTAAEPSKLHHVAHIVSFSHSIMHEYHHTALQHRQPTTSSVSATDQLFTHQT